MTYEEKNQSERTHFLRQPVRTLKSRFRREKAEAKSVTPTPHQQVLKALNGGIESELELDYSFGQVLAEKPWGETPSFPPYLLGPSPGGLSAITVARFKPLHRLMVEHQAYAELGEVLPHVVRSSHRPRKTPAPGETFVRFWGAPGGHNMIDYKLLKLKSGHPELYARVCAHDLDLNVAALEAGIVQPRNTSLSEEKCRAWLATLKERTQGKALCNIFDGAPLGP